MCQFVITFDVAATFVVIRGVDGSGAFFVFL